MPVAEDAISCTLTAYSLLDELTARFLASCRPWRYILTHAEMAEVGCGAGDHCGMWEDDGTS